MTRNLVNPWSSYLQTPRNWVGVVHGSEYMTKNWNNLHLDFTEKLQKEWEENNFTYEQVKEWIDICLRNEIEKTEDKLGYTTPKNWRAAQIKKQYLQEIPPKQGNCRIM